MRNAPPICLLRRTPKHCSYQSVVGPCAISLAAQRSRNLTGTQTTARKAGKHILQTSSDSSAKAGFWRFVRELRVRISEDCLSAIQAVATEETKMCRATAQHRSMTNLLLINEEMRKSENHPAHSVSFSAPKALSTWYNHQHLLLCSSVSTTRMRSF